MSASRIAWSNCSPGVGMAVIGSSATGGIDATNDNSKDF